MASRGVSRAGSAGTRAAALTRARGAAGAGSALLASAGKHKPGGVGRAGSALLGAAGGGGRGSGPGATAVTQAPAAPAAPPPTVQPFLTPDQQRALDLWNTSYGEQLGRLTQADADAQAKWTAATGGENLHFAQNNDLTNQSEAARGLFQSSIRANALADLSVTHAAALNTINTNRDTAINNDQIARQDLAGQNAAEQGYYSGIAVNNAQGVTPVTGDNAGVAGTAAASQHPAGAAPPAQHPSGVGLAGTALTSGAHALEQPRNTGMAAAGSALSAMHGAALQRVQQPSAPKPPGTGKVGLNIGPWQGAGGRVGAPR